MLDCNADCGVAIYVTGTVVGMPPSSGIKAMLPDNTPPSPFVGRMLTSSVAGALIGPAGTLNHPAELATARKLVVRPVLVGTVATAIVCEACISVVVLAKVSPDGLTASDPPALDGPPTANVIFAKPPVPWRVLIVTWPRYVPAGRLEAFTAIVILAGVVPLLALTWSHPCVGPKYRTPTSNVVRPRVEVTLMAAVAVVVERAGKARLTSVGDGDTLLGVRNCRRQNGTGQQIKKHQCERATLSMLTSTAQERN
jgi:hypothetical protein